MGRTEVRENSAAGLTLRRLEKSVLGRRSRGTQAVLEGILLPALPVPQGSSMPGSCSLGPEGRQVLRMADPAN